ncbi:Uncharacterised protein [uncultured archaeon]|nr:Uncharacterised protein [uncultured archaeon]
MRNTIKMTLAGALMQAIGCVSAGPYNPPTRTQPLVPETPISTPVEPKEQPKPQIEENAVATEIPVGYTAENQEAFDYLCGIAQSKETPLDYFEQIQLAVKISKTPNEGKATLDDLANAFEAIKGEEFKLNYTETIYAEESQKEAIEELVNKAVKDSNLQQKIEFIKDARCTENTDLVPAAQVKIAYTIKDRKAFDEYCKTVEEKDGQTLDEFGKVLLAATLDTDNDGIVTLADIARGYATTFPGEKQLSYSLPVLAATGQEKAIATLIRKELEGKSLTETIAFIDKLRKKAEQAQKPQAPKAPASPNPTQGKYKAVDVPVKYGFEGTGANRFEQICKHESRTDPYQRIQFAASLDNDKNGIFSGKEGGDYVLEKFKKDRKYLTLAASVPPEVKDPANLASFVGSVEVEEGLAYRFSKWLSEKNMYERAMFLRLVNKEPECSRIDDAVMTVLEKKTFK